MDHELCVFNTHSWFYSGDNIKSLEEFDQEYKYARRNNSDLRSFFPLCGAVKNKTNVILCAKFVSSNEYLGKIHNISIGSSLCQCFV